MSTTTTRSTEEIRRIVADLYDAFSTGDAAPWASRLSTEHEPTGIGTDPQEFWVGREQLTRVFDAQVTEMHAAGISFEGGDAVVEIHGDVAWIADQPTLRMGDATIPVRLTMVLTAEGGDWQMAHFHLSNGVPNETMLDTSLTV